VTVPAQPAPITAAARGPDTSAPANVLTNAPNVATGPLSPDHLRALTAARLRMKKITRASNVARFGGWTLGFFAIITIAFGLPRDFVSISLGAALCVVAFNELRGGALLKQLKPAGAALLGYNQLGLGTLTVAYASFQLWNTTHGSSITQAIGSTGDPDTDAMVQSLTATLTYSLYGTLALLGALIPGLTAWYYFSRRKLVHAMLRETPAWVVDVLRT